ncbi:MAG: hypothetical protein Q9227_001114 [Pyrenula ochraceoflavens]
MEEFPVPPCELIHDPLTAHTIVPLAPCSTFFVDYKVEEPVPPNSMFLFKLLCNDGPLATWDCTAKSGYKGKALWSIKIGSPDGNRGIPPLIRDYLGKRHRKRRYRYQLLDARNRPFATFVFYYGQLSQLQRIGIAPVPLTPTRLSIHRTNEAYDSVSSSDPSVDKGSQYSESQISDVIILPSDTLPVKPQFIDSNEDEGKDTTSLKKARNIKNLRLCVSNDGREHIVSTRRSISPSDRRGTLDSEISPNLTPQTAPPKILAFQDIDEGFEAQQAEKERRITRDVYPKKQGQEKQTAAKPMISPEQKVIRQKIGGIVKGLLKSRLERTAAQHRETSLS